jgi:hypothetical protein
VWAWLFACLQYICRADAGTPALRQSETASTLVKTSGQTVLGTGDGEEAGT